MTETGAQKGLSVGVIGAGVSGLSCAVLLQEAGFRVSITAAVPPEKTTSAAAAAVWFPYHAGNHPRTEDWCRRTAEYCRGLHAVPGSGIFFTSKITWFRKALPVLPEVILSCERFRYLEKGELPAPFVGGYAVTVPFMNSAVYLPFLLEKFRAAGGELVLREVASLAAEARRHDVLVNCTGVGARELCSDDRLQPGKGQVVVTTNPGLTDCIVDSDGMTHVFPRGNVCILGGINDIGNGDAAADPEITADMLARATALVPAIKQATVLEVKTGLRPLRPAVRLEEETMPGGGTVIHNYGHGGAGYTLSHGCARDVVALVKRKLL